MENSQNNFSDFKQSNSGPLVVSKTKLESPRARIYRLLDKGSNFVTSEKTVIRRDAKIYQSDVKKLYSRASLSDVR